MGFLSNLRDKSEAVFVEGDDTYTLEIIKESNYQSHLKKLCGGYSKEGNNHEEVAKLYYDNKQSKDKNAIRVVMKKKTVGYLCDEDAKRYRKRLKRLSEEGIVIECNAKIFGGTKLGLFDKTSFEVWLDLSIEDFTIQRAKPSIEEVTSVEKIQTEEVIEKEASQEESIEIESPKKPKPILPIDL